MMNTMNDKVKCSVCAFESHSLVEHIKVAHQMTPGQYEQRYQKPVASDWIKKLIAGARRPRRAILELTPVERLAREAIQSSGKLLNKVIVSQGEVGTVAKKEEENNEEYWQIPGTRIRLPVNKENKEARPPLTPWEVPEELAAFVWAYSRRHHTYIMGESGLGKSLMVRQVFAYTKQKYYDVTSHGNATKALLLGCNSIVGGDTKFVYGPLVRAMKEGVPLLWEEMDRTPSRLTTLAHTVMQEGRLEIDETGETVIAQPGFCIIGTGNTKGRGDTSGRYTSAEVMDGAFIRRFPTKIEMLALNDKKQLDLLMKKYPAYEKVTLERIVRMSSAIREGCTKEEIFGTFGIADMINFVDHLENFDPMQAMRLSYTNTLATNDAEVVNKLVNLHLPSVGRLRMENQKPSPGY